MSSGIQNLWDVAAAEVKYNDDQSNFLEKYVLVVGGKSSGKTSAILKFLARDEAPKPTIALEYTFARKSSSMQSKMTGHIWELGGGTNLTKLLDIPFNLDTIKRITVILVLDLSQPSKLWHTAETLISEAREKIDVVLKQGHKQSPGFIQKNEQKAWERIGGKDRNDADTINPFPVPLIVIGSKYDLFLEMSSENKQVVTKCLRFLAHSNGATVMFMSTRNEGTVRGFRHVMGVSAFDGQLSKTPVIDNNRPLFIPAGMDSIDAIGPPPLSSNDIGRTSAKKPKEVWRIAFSGHFPQDANLGKNNKIEIPDPCKDPQFREGQIDELRAQKDRELEAYRRQESQKWTARLN